MDKTVIMRTSRNLDTNVRIKDSDKIIKDEAKFIYCGICVNSDGNIDRERKRTIQIGIYQIASHYNGSGK
jgi:hypothetical protein